MLLQLGLPELINKYGDEVITNSDLTATGGLKNKDRVIRKLNIMFKHVETHGRGKNIQFTLSEMRSEYILDKRREHITELQSMLLHNLKYLIASDQLPAIPLTASQWIDVLGAKRFYEGAQELNKSLHKKNVEKHYLLNWKPDLDNYKDPDLDKIINDTTVIKEINYLISSWRKNQFEILIPKANYLGIEFSEVVMGKKVGKNEISRLSSSEKKRLSNFVIDYVKRTGSTSRMPWEDAEYNRIMIDMGYSKVYTMYTCKNSGKMTFANYMSVPKDKMEYLYIQALKEHVVRKEIGEYKGLFNGLTKLPYHLSLNRIELVEDGWILRSIEKYDLRALIAKRLQNDYELLLGTGMDNIKNKLIRSRMLYKAFKEVVKILCDIELDDDYYNKAIKDWETAYKKEVQSGIKPFSVMKLVKE
ncbi:hypothetical protein [Lactobacillus taiwanensis]|uniref:hypothetical protein n=1 Tax=Lactobacillus taiwanensis TaxID=508451 RepID=UPI00321FB5B6